MTQILIHSKCDRYSTYLQMYVPMVSLMMVCQHIYQYIKAPVLVINSCYDIAQLRRYSLPCLPPHCDDKEMEFFNNLGFVRERMCGSNKNNFSCKRFPRKGQVINLLQCFKLILSTSLLIMTKTKVGKRNTISLTYVSRQKFSLLILCAFV